MNIVSPAIGGVKIQEIELLMERSRPVDRIHAASLSAAALRCSATATHEEAVTAVAAWSVSNESLSSESRPNLSNKVEEAHYFCPCVPVYGRTLPLQAATQALPSTLQDSLDPIGLAHFIGCFPSGQLP